MQAGNKRNAQASGEKWVLAIGLLAASPAWIAENINVRRPDGEAAIPVRRAVGVDFGGVLSAKFRADGVGDVVHERLIERRGHANGLGKNGGDPRAGDAVKTFVPPVIGGNTEPRNRGSDVPGLVDFFVEGHAGNQIVGALFGGQLGIQIRRVRRRLLCG